MTYSTLAGLSRFRLISVVFEPHPISDFTVNLSAHDVETVVAFDVHTHVYFCYGSTSLLNNLEKICSEGGRAISHWR